MYFRLLKGRRNEWLLFFTSRNNIYVCFYRFEMDYRCLNYENLEMGNKVTTRWEGPQSFTFTIPQAVHYASIPIEKLH